MSAQLMWTLGQLPEVDRLKLEIDGEPVSPPGVGEVQSPRDWADNDPDATSGDAARQAYLRGQGGHLNLLLAGDRSFFLQAVAGVPVDIDARLLKMQREVTTEEVVGVFKDIFMPLFDPKTSCVTITCAPTMSEVSFSPVICLG